MGECYGVLLFAGCAVPMLLCSLVEVFPGCALPRLPGCEVGMGEGCRCGRKLRGGWGE